MLSSASPPVVQFPGHALVSGQTAELRISFPASLDYATVAFEFDEKQLVITGQNRLREKGTFECVQLTPDEPWEAVFTVAVREVKFAFHEPVTVFFADHNSSALPAVSGFLDLQPAYHLPGIFGYPSMVWGWFTQRLPELRGGTWVTILRSPLTVAAAVAVGYGFWLYYSKTEVQREDLLIALKLADPRFSRPSFKEDFTLLSGTTWTTAAQWSTPETWKVVAGLNLAPTERIQDGALLIKGPGRSGLSRTALAGEGFYDFKLETKFSFPENPGRLGLVVRAQRWTDRGYLFVVEPRDGALTVSGSAIGLFGRLTPLDPPGPVRFRDFPCCENGDYFRLVLTAKGSGFDFTVYLESDAAPPRDRLVGVATSLDRPVIRDPARSYRQGSVGFLNLDSQPGAKIELIEIAPAEPEVEKK